jgi:hypothetical protein
MNFGLLWIDALFVALLWVAALAACVGRLKRKWIRITVLSIVVLVPLILMGGIVYSTATMKFSLGLEPNWFSYAVLLLLGYIVGTFVILYQGSRREAGMPPAAAAWRREPLAFAWLTALAVGYMILVNMDLAVRARCAILSVQLNAVYLATLPAITSDAQNAAPIYEDAFARLKDDREDEERVQNPPTGNNENFDPNEPATITFLARQADTIALLRRAAALPACRFDSDLMNPDISAMMPILDEERNAANVVNLHAREEIARGHVSSAIDDAAAILGMSRHFGQRPLLMSALVGIGVDGMGNRTLEEALPAVKSPDELAGLHLEQLPSLGRVFQQALRGEECFGVALYGNMPKSELQTPQVSVVPSFGGPEGMVFRAFILDLDAYIKLLENLQDQAVQPYYKIANQIQHVSGLDRGNDLITSILAPSLRRALQTLAMGEAGDACTQTAVAMTRFKLDHATMPSRLDELVPQYLAAVPIDPFDGHPLRLAIRNNEWIIYSVGPDGVDNGGAAMLNGKRNLIFTFKAAAAATTRD